ncbi:MAG: hypothetical protein LBD91_08495 [Prevotellaceae bacterium]|jgi:hypothetical protein|nr:hypothetical protein [Prevotellaceae bacterium]
MKFRILIDLYSGNPVILPDVGSGEYYTLVPQFFSLSAQCVAGNLVFKLPEPVSELLGLFLNGQALFVYQHYEHTGPDEITLSRNAQNSPVTGDTLIALQVSLKLVTQ